MSTAIYEMSNYPTFSTKYFFDEIVSGVIYLISLADSSLLVYIKLQLISEY